LQRPHPGGAGRFVDRAPAFLPNASPSTVIPVGHGVESTPVCYAARPVSAFPATSWLQILIVVCASFAPPWPILSAEEQVSHSSAYRIATDLSTTHTTKNVCFFTDEGSDHKFGDHHFCPQSHSKCRFT